MVYTIPINAVKFRFRHQMQSDRIGFLGMFQPIRKQNGFEPASAKHFQSIIK